MRSNRNIVLLLISAMLLLCAVACSSGHHSTAATDTRILVSTQCDQGASISPTSIRVNDGDKPTFSIVLQGGYSIQTIFCTSGGSLIGNQFTMGSVHGDDNVHVVTMSRSVGSLIVPGSLEGVVAQFESTPKTEVLLRNIRATTVLTAAEFKDKVIHVSLQSEVADVNLVLHATLFGKPVVIPLARSGAFVHEANFAIGELISVPDGEMLPKLLHFSVKEDGAQATCGAIFITVKQ
jgi:hypothetical protein